MPPQTVTARKTDVTARLCNLPRFQPAALRLMSISTDSDSALEEFEKVFRGDPALASEVLQRANSAEFGLHARIGDIRSALCYIGLDQTRALAVTICMSRFAGSAARHVDTRQVWKHSIATALIAEHLAQASGHRSFSAYTAGLVHDVGRLGLLTSCPEEYTQILSRPFRHLDEANEVERIAFGMTHAEAGSFLARSWGFPAGLCGCILNHHDADETIQGELMNLVRSACALAAELDYPEVLQSEPTPPVLPRQVSLEELRALLEANINTY